MTAKLQRVAVVVLVLVPFTFNVSNAHPLGTKDVATILKNAMGDLKPKAKHRVSLLRTQIKLFKGDPEAQDSDQDAPDSDQEAALSFEKDISDLVVGLSQGGLSATPFANSVKNISDLISGVMMPQVNNASAIDQAEITRLYNNLTACESTKITEVAASQTHHDYYIGNSTAHKSCRLTEKGLYDDNVACHTLWGSLRNSTTLTCQAFTDKENEYTDTTDNIEMMKLAPGPESAETYIRRITGTICGTHATQCSECGTEGTGGWHGFLDDLITHKTACTTATDNLTAQTALCKSLDEKYHGNRTTCDSLQDTMDWESCKWATMTNDACQKYEGCYTSKRANYDSEKLIVETQEADRKAEWIGLKRIKCIIDAFATPEDSPGITEQEIEDCKNPTQADPPMEDYTTDHLIIDYHNPPDQKDCIVNQSYPNTGYYHEREYEPLPTSAKGKEDANECAGMIAVNTEPNPLSKPDSCICERLTMEGPYSAGPLVRCTGCTPVYRSTDTNSCPELMKLFAPASREDWATFLESADPNRVRDPNFIVDITRPENGCEPNCAVRGIEGESEDTAAPFSMNLEVQQTEISNHAERWATKDGAHWWLRSSAYTSPTADYQANCYLDIGGTPYGGEDAEGNWAKPADADSITFRDDQCNFHSKAYYCQPKDLSLKPKAGSPSSCKCEEVALSGEYSVQLLIRCQKCLDVYKSTQKNSCPVGTKLFSPQSRADWATFLANAGPLRNPHWIIDITRTTNGCGGCTEYAMNSGVPSQATWHTSDNSPWFLRDTVYTQPDGDYEANCYMDLTGNPSSESPTITFGDDSCNIHSRSYYCQGAPTTTTTTTTLPAKCDTLFSSDKCPSGVTKGDLETLSCTTNPCEESAEDLALCCEPKAKCDSHYSDANCPSGTAQDSLNTLECTSTSCVAGGPDDDLCCKPKGKCDTYETGYCPSGALVANPEATECTGHLCEDSDADDALCCEALQCAAHTCAAGSIKISGIDTVPHGGDSESACCEVSCAIHNCSAGNIKRSGVDNVAQGAAPESACCEATCAVHTCAEGYQKKADIESVAQGDDAALTCCEGEATTSTSAAVEAGATTLEVGSTDGFQVGREVVIDAENPSKTETNEVASFGSLVLLNPLVNDHAAGVSISMLYQVATLTLPASPSTDSTSITDSSASSSDSGLPSLGTPDTSGESTGIVR